MVITCSLPLVAVKCLAVFSCILCLYLTENLNLRPFAVKSGVTVNEHVLGVAAQQSDRKTRVLLYLCFSMFFCCIFGFQSNNLHNLRLTIYCNQKGNVINDIVMMPSSTYFSFHKSIRSLFSPLSIMMWLDL